MQLDLSNVKPVYQRDYLSEYVAAEEMQQFSHQLQRMMQYGTELTDVMTNTEEVLYILQQGPLTQATFEFLNMNGELSKAVGTELTWSDEKAIEIYDVCLETIGSALNTIWTKFKAFVVGVFKFLFGWIPKLKDRIMGKKKQVEEVNEIIAEAKKDPEVDKTVQVHVPLTKDSYMRLAEHMRNLPRFDPLEMLKQVDLLSHTIKTEDEAKADELIDTAHAKVTVRMNALQKLHDEVADSRSGDSGTMNFQEFERFAGLRDEALKMLTALEPMPARAKVVFDRAISEMEHSIAAHAGAASGKSSWIAKKFAKDDNLGTKTITKVTSVAHKMLQFTLVAINTEASICSLYIDECDQLAKIITKPDPNANKKKSTKATAAP
jgi:hypothetical protein